MSEHEARIRLGKLGRVRVTVRGATPAEASRRETQLREMVRQLFEAGHGERAEAFLRKAESASDVETFRKVLSVATKLCAGKADAGAASAKATKTFREVGEWWTSGDAHRDFPDHVRHSDHTMDEGRLARLYGAPVAGGTTLGDVPVDRFTIDHAQAAMTALEKLRASKFARQVRRPATRRQYAQLLNRVLTLAVWPLRVIEANPLPRGFLPKIGKPPAYAYLYPAEDAALLASVGDAPQAVPLAFRLLYGFLAREGCRLGEALDLRWRDLDLEKGVLTLDRNKTDDARAWVLDPGVARALDAWKARLGEGGSELVFVHEGGVIVQDGLAERLRADLLVAGVTRPELHTSGENRGQFRVHDLRGTFVTLSLACGKSETWVADRTGHTSSQMINRYRRAARSATELGLGQLAPLDEAIPEFSSLKPSGSPPPRRSHRSGGPRGGPDLVGRPGLEPGTYGLKIRSSNQLSYRPCGRI
jgi:integrase